MVYHVKELFYSLQGEGANSGRAAVFCRFSGCNLWSGREQDRAKAACNFCDTDFVGGDQFKEAVTLADAVASLWPVGEAGTRLVILTGGEPGLQVDTALVDALHKQDFEVAIETNGTLDLPPGIDWVTVSPKGDETVKTIQGDELKLVYPQTSVDPAAFTGMAFSHFFLQPKAGPDEREHTAQALDYCRRHPRWRLSLQTHKILGIR